MIKYVQIFLIIFIIILLIFFHFRGFAPYDEGWVIYASQRFFNGEVPYKDFQFVYTPGVLFVDFLAYHLINVSVFSTRIFALINSLISIFFLYKISRSINFSTLFTSIVIGTFLAWGPSHTNFVWPVMFSISTGLGMIYFLQKENNAKSNNYIYSGVFALLCLLFKQNFGFAIFSTAFIYFLFTKNKKYFLKQFSIGVIFVSVLFLFYLLLTGSFHIFLSEMYTLTFKRVLLGGMLSRAYPWEFPQPLIYKLLKVTLYFYPGWISIIAILISFKKDKSKIFLSFFTLSFFALSIRPTTDLIHLAPLLSISAIPTLLIFKQLKNSFFKIIVLILSLLIISSGIFSIFSQGYYKWGPKTKEITSFSNLNTTNVYMSKTETQDLQNLYNYVNKHYKDEKYTFVYFFNPGLYTILEKDNPTKYDYAGAILTPATRLEIIDVLSKKKIKFVILDIPINDKTDNILNFVDDNYNEVFSSGQFKVFEIKQ